VSTGITGDPPLIRTVDRLSFVLISDSEQPQFWTGQKGPLTSILRRVDPQETSASSSPTRVPEKNVRFAVADRCGSCRQVPTHRLLRTGDMTVVHVRETPSENLGVVVLRPRRKNKGKTATVLRANGTWADSYETDEADRPGTPTLLANQLVNDLIDADFVVCQQEIDIINHALENPADDASWSAAEGLFQGWQKRGFKVDCLRNLNGKTYVHITKGEERLKYCVIDQTEEATAVDPAPQGADNAGQTETFKPKFRAKLRKRRHIDADGVPADRWRKRLSDDYNL
jgi:hypothetical protein